METKFEKLPEDVRNLILEIYEMKEKNRQNLEYLRRTNLRTLDELSEDVQMCRLVSYPCAFVVVVIADFGSTLIGTL